MRLSLGVVVAALTLASGAAHAADTGDLIEAIQKGKPILEFRPRYENVDQANLARDAAAFTLRTRLGWETAAWHGFKALIEFEDVRQLGSEHYNTTINGKTTFPIIADPDVTELNRAQLTWTPNKAFTATVGRQRVNLDDQRFIGSVGWRQDEQTLDAVRGDFTHGKFKATYLYIGQVNRIYGEALDWDSDSHALNATYGFSDAFKLQGFLYALQFKQAPASSTNTWGVKATGALKLAPFKLAYAASYAKQTDYRNNPGDFSLDYWMGEAAATYDIYTLKVNYESLEGDGKRGFATPLATLHAFQGWADVFLTTPTRGINDVNVSFSIKPKLKLPHLSNVELFVRRHDFSFQQGSGDLGSEWDAQVTASFTKQLTGLIKFADYDGVAGIPSRRKVWLGLEFKL
ncbi:MAG: alginate export family protein [Caulobacteraceae bacterium]